MPDRYTCSFDLSLLKTLDSGGKRILTIYATDTLPDKVRDRCSEECLQKMAAQIKEKRIELLNSHFDAVGFGRAVDGRVVPAEDVRPELAGTGAKALLVDVELDENNPFAQALWDRALAGEDDITFSIGAWVKKGVRGAIRWERGARVLEDVELDHITASRKKREANPRTGIAGAVLKSLEAANALDDFQREQAPDTVRRLLSQFVDNVDELALSPSVSTVVIRGKTSEDVGHSHFYVATIDGMTGTMRGITSREGEGMEKSHFHPIDLIADEEPITSSASRGTPHRHRLGVSAVKEILKEQAASIDFESYDALNALFDQPEQFTGDNKMPEDKTTEEQHAAAIPAETHQPSEQETSFMRLLKRLFVSAAEPSNPSVVVSTIEDLSSAVGDYIEQGGSIDELTRALVELNKRVAGLRVDRDSVSVRTAKFIDVIDSAGLLRPMSEPVFQPEPTPEPSNPATGEEEKPQDEAHASLAADAADQESESAAEAGEETQSTDQQASAEPAVDNTTEETSMGAQNVDEIVERAAGLAAEKAMSGTLSVLVKAGVLPQSALEEAEEDTPKPEAEDQAASAAPADDAEQQSAEGAADQKPEDEASEGVDQSAAAIEALAQTADKILGQVESLATKINDLEERISAVEKQPAPRQSQDTHASVAPTNSGKGLFSGALGLREPK